MLGFSGIATTTDASSIKKCAVGQLESRRLGAIITNNETGNSTVKENIYIDSIETPYGHNPEHGAAVAAARFNQRYFEHTMGWDFENVWIWDSKNNRPDLRQVGVNAVMPLDEPAAPKPTTSGENSVDLLTQQVKANIWL